MKSAPEPAHLWLRKFLGEWTYEGEATMKPGEPPEKFAGDTETVRAIGEFWILAEGRGQMPDGNPSTSILTLG